MKYCPIYKPIIVVLIMKYPARVMRKVPSKLNISDDSLSISVINVHLIQSLN